MIYCKKNHHVLPFFFVNTLDNACGKDAIEIGCECIFVYINFSLVHLVHPIIPSIQ